MMIKYICIVLDTIKYILMEIAEIKSQLTITQVLSHYNLWADKNNRLRCPWHEDKTPSLQIYPKTNTWTCFSSNCNAGSGDVIDMVMKLENLTKHKALKKAAELCGETPKEPKPSRTAILTKFYQSTLQAINKSTNGKEYIASRSIDYNQLHIGFSGYAIGKTWDKELYSQAEQLGLFKIRNCIIFPTKNKEGQIVSIYGRSVSANPRVRHFYLAGGFKGLYPSYPKPTITTLILTESIIDAATIRQYTDHEVIALYGTNGFTKEHTEAVSQLTNLSEIILFFDGDEAGKAAVKKYTKQLQKLWPKVQISHVNTPEGEDPNSLIQSHDDKEILSHLITQRVQTSRNAPQAETQKECIKTGTLNTDNPELLTYTTTTLYLTILGGIKITGLDRLKVTLKIEKREYSHHLPVRHSLDLYHSKQVEQLCQKIAESLEVGSSESERVISQLTAALEQYRQSKLELLKPKKAEKKEMTAGERTEAIRYLKNKKLLRNTLEDIAKSGIVGETNNSLIAYLAYTSRKRKKPLHIMCLGASGTGKTYLQEKVSELIPEEDKIEITSLSDNAFYYFGREELKHKLILIEDLDGAENVLYPLRELQSKRRITKTVTLKDNKGNLKTITLRVEGPVCVSGCTTRERIYEDNANRCILLYIDGSNEQDKRIMSYQQSASAGTIDGSAEHRITTQLQNVQRLLRPIKVVNPYAEIIDLPDQVFKPRRTLLLLLSFIETITFYHQWQRAQRINEITKEPYIESTKEDIAAAFSLMKEVLFSKSDELTNASRNFLEGLKKNTEPGEIFYSNQLRKKLRIPSSTLKRYLYELVRNGYVKVRGGSKYRGFEYEVVDYEEYKELQSSIDEKLASILSKIKTTPAVGGGSVAQ